MAITDPRTRSRRAVPADDADRLTDEQLSAVALLPDGHEYLGVLGGTPVVRGPDGRLSRIRTSGRLVRTRGVSAAESYLLVRG